jgi:hypothetical protein
MTVSLLDTPNNGKLVSFTDPADIGATGEIVLDSLAKQDQAFIAMNDTTKETYIVQNGVVQALGAFTRYELDFDTDGGAIGDITLRGPQIPDNSRVLRGFYEVTTTFTSSTDAATIAIGIPTDDAAGIVAATAISAGGNVWDAGIHETIQTGTTANASEKTTAARAPVATVAVEALTAGSLELFLQVVSEKN